MLRGEPLHAVLRLHLQGRPPRHREPFDRGQANAFAENMGSRDASIYRQRGPCHRPSPDNPAEKIRGVSALPRRRSRSQSTVRRR